MILLLFGQMVTSDILRAVGVSSLAASAFICFMLPKGPVAKSSRIWFSYTAAISIGVLFSLLYAALPVQSALLYVIGWQELLALCAVCLTSFLMMLFKRPHPPAAGLTLGLVLDDWSAFTVLAIICSISIITLIKVSVESRLNNLC